MKLQDLRGLPSPWYGGMRMGSISALEFIQQRARTPRSTSSTSSPTAWWRCAYVCIQGLFERIVQVLTAREIAIQHIETFTAQRNVQDQRRSSNEQARPRD